MARIPPRRAAVLLLGITPLLFSLVLDAQQQHASFQYGDIIAGGQTDSVVTPLGRFDWLLPDGTLNLRMGDVTFALPLDVALDPAGNAYFPTFFGIEVFDTNGRFLKNFPNFPTFASVITFDGDGNAYIADTGYTVSKTTPAGDLLATFLFPVENPSKGGVSAMDLASDQCTMYYTAFGKRVFRYDVCRAVPLPDFATALPGFRARQLRILPDGGVLVADTELIVRLDSAGTVVQTYDLPGQQYWTNVAIHVDARSFWATSLEQAYRFDLTTGAVLASFQSEDYFFNAITVVGEPRAAFGAAAAAAIPTLSEWFLIALTLSLSAVAVMRLKS